MAAQLAQIIHPFPVKPIFLCHLVGGATGDGGRRAEGGAVRQVSRPLVWEWNRQPQMLATLGEYLIFSIIDVLGVH